MTRTHTILLAGLSAALLAAGLLVAPGTSVSAQTEQSVWSIGPTIRGKNYSFRMPPTMAPVREGAAFDFPHPAPEAGHVHYVTTPTGSLADARRIVMR